MFGRWYFGLHAISRYLSLTRALPGLGRSYALISSVSLSSVRMKGYN